METETLYQIAITMVPQIGAVHARSLIEHFGSAEGVFRAKRSSIEKVEGIGFHRARKIKSFNSLARAEAELKFLGKYKIRALYLTHPDYPKRLLNCYDPPTIIYYKGRADLNGSRVLSIVGTRMNSAYGQQVTEHLIRDLAPFDVVIVSGLAFGIDAIAHKTCIRYQVPTIGVVGHGLDTVYPPQHSNLARDMVKDGGLLSEFMSGVKPDKHNFPTRNRIVAGISDATIVVETSKKGGSMITADIANGYNRDVFAIPGKVSDAMSEGTNQLIKSNKAMLLGDAQDIVQTLGWEQVFTKKASQRSLFVDLSEDEKRIVELLQEKGKLVIDELNYLSRLSRSSIAAAILNLEMNGVINSLPGKAFTLT